MRSCRADSSTRSLLKTTFPLASTVLTSENPHPSKIACSSSFLIRRCPPTLIPRSSATYRIISLLVIGLLSSLVVGRWSLVVGRWSLVVGRWNELSGYRIATTFPFHLPTSNDQ